MCTRERRRERTLTALGLLDRGGERFSEERKQIFYNFIENETQLDSEPSMFQNADKKKPYVYIHARVYARMLVLCSMYCSSERFDRQHETGDFPSHREKPCRNQGSSPPRRSDLETGRSNVNNGIEDDRNRAPSLYSSRLHPGAHDFLRETVGYVRFRRK